MKRFFNNPMVPILLIFMVGSAIMGGRFSNFSQWLYNMILTVPGLLIGFAFHEFGHAKMADILGDDTPRLQGRVTLNPIVHIDPVGLIFIIIAGFGWGKAVEINPNNFENQRKGSFLVSIAGVTINLILGFIFCGMYMMINRFMPEFISGEIGKIVSEIIYRGFLINIVLMVFNLLPIPPLDGFNAITELFNLRKYEIWYKIYNLGFGILLIFMLLGFTSSILPKLIQAVCMVIMKFWLLVLF